MDTTDETTPGVRGPADDVEGHVIRIGGRAMASGRDVRDHPADPTQPHETGQDVEAHGIKPHSSIKDTTIEGGTLVGTEIGFPFKRG